MVLKDGERMRCPLCGGTIFCATAHVTQDWELNETGTFQECLNDCVEVTHFCVPYFILLSKSTSASVQS